MNLVSMSEFSRIVGVSRQRILQLVEAGAIDVSVVGGRRMIDADSALPQLVSRYELTAKHRR